MTIALGHHGITLFKYFIGMNWVVGYGHSINKVFDHMDQSDKTDPKALLDHIPHPTVIMEFNSHSVISIGFQ